MTLNPAARYPGFRYRERLRLVKPITLQRASDAEGGRVTVVWETNEPYRPCWRWRLALVPHV